MTATPEDDSGPSPLELSAALGESPELVAARVEGLSGMALFEDCTVDQLTAVAQRLRPLQADAGEVLMRQGDEAVSFILVQSGRAEVSHRGDNGIEVLDEIPAGDIVGEIALLRAKPRTATVTATEQLSGYIGDAKAFVAIADLPGVSERLLRLLRQRLAAFITPIPVPFKDGSELFLRPVLPGDTEQASHPSVEFSEETLYRRFMSTRAPTPTLLHYLFHVDYVDHFVWVLVDGVEGPVVADARFVREVENPSEAEIAFIVADEYQGRGIGSFLMDALTIAARVCGVQRFTARLLAENGPMRAILDHYDVEWEREEPGVVITAFDVPELEDLRVDAALAEQIRSVTRQVVRASVG